MKAVILQSPYMPWLGFFNMVDWADVFVFLDDVQWTKSDWRNRNRVRTPQGWTWLTVPTTAGKHYRHVLIKDVQIDNSQNWQDKHLKTLEMCYKHTSYFTEIFPLIEAVFNARHVLISELNYDLTAVFCHYLCLHTKFLYSQSMNLPIEAQKDDKLLAILQHIGDVDTYLSGPSAQGYLNEEKFNAVNIKVEWHHYQHPYYNQRMWSSNTFISHLSILDLLFNHGRASRDIITGKIKIEKPNTVQIVKAGEN